jgi:nucleotide-binding universal stress UspA family protein
LRETRAPVLVTPAGDRGPATLDDVRKTVGRILVPVDLTDALEHHVQAARRLAETLDVPMLLVHIVEPVRAIVPGRAYAAHVDSERRDRAERRLQALVDAMPAHPRAEALVVFGEPAEEIAKIAVDRHAGLIVVGLHASPILGPRMGSVTYRVLSLAHGLVLALPPA